jgi:Ser/Thr protein kinase RdoA (MazF antagonist)
MECDSTEICAWFSLGQLICVDRTGGTRNTNFVFLTDRGKWLVRRRYEGYCDLGRVLFDHEAARFLSEKGVPVVPPLPGVDGNTYWQHRGALWEAYRFVEGRHLLDGVGEDVLALASSVAHLHKAGASFELRYEKGGPRGETDPEHLLASIERVRAESPDARESALLYQQAVVRAAADLPSKLYSSLPHTLVHGDIQPANVLINDGRVGAFVDLDWCAWRPRIYDLCFAIICCCARHRVPIGSGEVWSLAQTPNLDARTLQEFLNLYEGQSAPLTAGERVALPPQIILSWCHIRIDNSLKVPAHERRRFLARKDWTEPSAQAVDAPVSPLVVRLIESLRQVTAWQEQSTG